jgi:hypothetical protein
MNNELIAYIKAQIENGKSDESIKQELLNVGWSESEIENAFNSKPSLTPQPTTTFAQPVGSQKMDGPVELLKKSFVLIKERWLPSFILIGATESLIFLVTLIVIFLTGGFFLLEIFTGGVMKEGVNLNITNLLMIIIPTAILLTIIYLSFTAAYFQIIINGSQGILKDVLLGFKKSFGLFVVILISFLIESLGLIFFIIPGVCLIINFYLAPFVYFSEERKGINALIASTYYLKKYKAAFLTRTIFIALINLLFSTAVSNITSLITDNNIVNLVIKFNISILTTILITTYFYLIYQNLKTIKGSAPSLIPNKQKIKYIIALVFSIFLFFAIPILVYLRIDDKPKNYTSNPNPQEESSIYDLSTELLDVDNYSRDIGHIAAASELYNAIRNYKIKNSAYPWSPDFFASTANDPQVGLCADPQCVAEGSLITDEHHFNTLIQRNPNELYVYYDQITNAFNVCFIPKSKEYRSNISSSKDLVDIIDENGNYQLPKECDLTNPNLYNSLENSCFVCTLDLDNFDPTPTLTLN